MDARILFYDKTARFPSENLAINRACADLVKSGKKEFIGRIYSHKKGVILGKLQSISDVCLDACRAQGYEVVKRPSGGSAVVVDEDSAVCYSLFFPLEAFEKLDLDKIYKKVALPLAEALGSEFAVEGAYYLRVKKDGRSVPVAGHALYLQSEGVVQFDGILHLRSLDADAVSKLLKLRDLYQSDAGNFFAVDGRYYTLKGQEITDIDVSKASLVRSEKKELACFPGLLDLGVSLEDFVSALHSVVCGIFGPVEITGAFDFGTLKTSSDKKFGSHSCLGHCFVDLVEPEPKL